MIIVLSSSKKSSSSSDKIPKHQELRELGDKTRFRGDFKDAYKYYMDSLYHLENDYKNQKPTKLVEKRRQIFISEIKHKIEIITPKLEA